MTWLLRRFAPAAAGNKIAGVAEETPGWPICPRWVRLGGFAVGYAVAYQLAYLFLDAQKAAALIWPAAGVGLVGLLLSPRREWKWVLLTAATISLGFNLALRKDLGISLSFASLTTAELGVCAAILRRFGGGRPDFGRLRDVLSFILITLGVVGLFGVGAAAIVGPQLKLAPASLMRTWWTAHGLAILVLTPLLALTPVFPRRWPRARVFEALGLLAASVGIAGLIGSAAGALDGAIFSPRYLAFVAVVWSALRFGPKGTAAVLVVITFGILATVRTEAPEANPYPMLGYLGLTQLFLAVVAMTGLLLAASIAESRGAQERYRSAIQNSTIGLSVVTTEGRWLEANPALCDILGYNRDELLERDVHEVTPVEDREIGRRQMAAMLSGREKTVEFEKRYRHKSGRLVWVRLHVALVRDAHGRPRHFVTQTLDITARKEAEASLEAAAERLALALRASKLGIWRHNLQTYAIEWDARMSALFDFPVVTECPTLDQILARVVPEDQPRVRQSWQVTPDGDRNYLMRFRLLRRDGRIRQLELHGSVRDDALGRPDWIIGVASDITDIVDATAESERLRLQLQQSQKMEALGKVAAGVAHDFNNLLTGINCFVDLATMTVGPDHEAAAMLKQARRGAVSARDLVRRILNFSRGNREQRRVLVDVVEVVHEATSLVAAGLPGHVALALGIECETAPVMADAGQLQQILMNLCANGAHAIGGNPGKVQIGVRIVDLGAEDHPAIPSGCVAGRAVRLAVTDTGCGMDEETCRKLFQPFFTTKKAGEGTGLGLSIVRDILNAHEGGVEVHSTPGVGTTFAVYFPLAGQVAEERTLSVPPAPPPGEKGPRVLVVDDDACVAGVVRLVLERHGYRPEVFSSPAAAWARFAAAPASYDVLMVDQNMPEIGGVEFVRRARQLVPALPVVAISARFVPNSEFPALGATQLKKPFEIAELMAAVRTALDRVETG